MNANNWSPDIGSKLNMTSALGGGGVFFSLLNKENWGDPFVYDINRIAGS